MLFVIFGYEKLRLLFFFWYFKNLSEIACFVWILNFLVILSLSKKIILLLINLWIFGCETRVFSQELIIPSKKILFYTFLFLNISLNILIQNKKKKIIEFDISSIYIGRFTRMTHGRRQNVAVPCGRLPLPVSTSELYVVRCPAWRSRLCRDIR